MSKSALTILGLLAEQPMHGYEILQTISDRQMNKWLRLSTASIYKTLNLLKEDEQIVEQKEKVGKLPERNVFSITEKGHANLKFLVEKFLNTYEHTDYPFGLGVAFLPFADKEIALSILKKKKKDLEVVGEELKVDIGESREIPYNWQALKIIGAESWSAELKQVNFLIENLTKAINDGNGND